MFTVMMGLYLGYNYSFIASFLKPVYYKASSRLRLLTVMLASAYLVNFKASLGISLFISMLVHFVL